MYSQCLSFGTEEGASLPYEVDIPSASSMDTSREGSDALNIADTKGTVCILLVSGLSNFPAMHFVQVNMGL